jgi:hypothetical protein
MTDPRFGTLHPALQFLDASTYSRSSRKCRLEATGSTDVNAPAWPRQSESNAYTVAAPAANKGNSAGGWRPEASVDDVHGYQQPHVLRNMRSMVRRSR